MMMRHLPQAGPRHEEHRERGEGDDAGGAQVGLQGHERDDAARDAQERQGAAEQAADAGAAAGHPVREIDDERQLGDLGGMERLQRADRSATARSCPPTGEMKPNDGPSTTMSSTSETRNNGTETSRSQR